MKLMHLAIAALLAATVAPAAHAEELENPAEGAVRRVYNFYSIHKHKEEIHKQNFIETSREILAGVKSAYATEVDRGTTFKSNGREETAMWMGYLKRKNGGEYTLVVDTNGGNIGLQEKGWRHLRQPINLGGPVSTTRIQQISPDSRLR